jgi:hypothetical protein
MPILRRFTWLRDIHLIAVKFMLSLLVLGVFFSPDAADRKQPEYDDQLTG